MSVTMGTALEIYTNPRDLQILVYQPVEGGKWSFSISRGPGHNFKPLLSTTPYFETDKEAREEIASILQTICQLVPPLLTDPKNLAAEVLNPDSQTIDQGKVLTHELLERIMKDLVEKQAASTYKY